MRRAVHVVDLVTEWAGRVVCWLVVALILIITYEVSMRYIFNAPSGWAFETCEMVGGTAYLVGIVYALKHNDHIRIDVIYARLPISARAIIDFLGDLIIFFPFVILVTLESMSWTMDSWRTGEVMTHSAWYPPAAPWRTILTATFALLAVQGVAQFIRHTYLLVRRKAI